MFGISLIEFFTILIIAILVIGPKDLPEVARHLIKAFGRVKYLITNAKNELDELGKEIGIDDIKNEVEMELANEKAAIEKDVSTIIDIYGNEHQVFGVDEIRKDKNKEEIAAEIDRLNDINKSSKW